MLDKVTVTVFAVSISWNVAIAKNYKPNFDENSKVLEEDLKKGGTTTIGQLAAMTCAQVV